MWIITLVSPGIVRVVGGIKGYIPVKEGFAGGNPEYTDDNGNIINTAGTKTRPWYSSSSDRTGYFCAKKWIDYNLTGNYGPQKIFGDQNQILLRYVVKQG